MTESTAPAAVAPKTSFWEDVFDIFVSPAAVFRRRQNSSIWPPMLFVAISIAVIFFVTYNTLQPIFDAEFSRNTAKMKMIRNPNECRLSSVVEHSLTRGCEGVTYCFDVVSIVRRVAESTAQNISER